MRDTKLTLGPILLPTGRRRYRIYANINGRIYREKFDDHQRALCRFKELESWKTNLQIYPPSPADAPESIAARRC